VLSNKKTVFFLKTKILVNLILLIPNTNKNLTIPFSKQKDKTLLILIPFKLAKEKTPNKTTCLELLETIIEAVLIKVMIIHFKQEILSKIMPIMTLSVMDFLNFKMAEDRLIKKMKVLTILSEISKTQRLLSFEIIFGFFEFKQ
jgi:hypothetical protein